jgi:phytoene dehydrogenase-like protein
VAEFDAIIIGGGHNGLVTAAYLARAGARVAVLEQRSVLGGAAVTEEPWPGFRINTFSYAAGLLRPKIVDDLELARFGYETILLEPDVYVPFPDGRSITLWNDLEKTLREIRKFSEVDARAYPKYLEYWDNVLELVEPLLLAPPAPLSELLQLFPGDRMERLVRELFLLSGAEMLDEWFESDQLKAPLCTSAIIGTLLGPRSPGTAYVLLHHKLGHVNGTAHAWGVAKGGMGAISASIARAAEHYGAVLRPDAPVRRILVTDGKTVGVETQDGRQWSAPIVASSVDARHTFLDLLPPDALDADFVRAVRRIKSRGAALKFNAALDGLPDFVADPGAPRAHHRGFVDIIPSIDYAERAYEDARRGQFSASPFMDCIFQSVLDPSVAPAGSHTMTCFVQYAPRDLANGNWEEAKPAAAETVLRTLEAYAPNLRRVIRHWQIISPEDIERTIGMTGGNIFQGDITPDQLFTFRPVPGWAGYRTPIRGLYLCGSAAHPGGGVMGAPGHNAARTILEDIRASGSSSEPSPPSRAPLSRT